MPGWTTVLQDSELHLSQQSRGHSGKEGLIISDMRTAILFSLPSHNCCRHWRGSRGRGGIQQDIFHDQALSTLMRRRRTRALPGSTKLESSDVTCYNCGKTRHFKAIRRRVMPVFKPRERPWNLSNDEPSLMADIHLQGQGQVTQLDQAYDTLVDIDTGAQISCILEQWARDKDLNPTPEGVRNLLLGSATLGPKLRARYTIRDVSSKWVLIFPSDLRRTIHSRESQKRQDIQKSSTRKPKCLRPCCYQLLDPKYY